MNREMLDLMWPGTDKMSRVYRMRTSVHCTLQHATQGPKASIMATNFTYRAFSMQPIYYVVSKARCFFCCTLRSQTSFYLRFFI